MKPLGQLGFAILIALFGVAATDLTVRTTHCPLSNTAPAGQVAGLEGGPHVRLLMWNVSQFGPFPLSPIPSGHIARVAVDVVIVQRSPDSEYPLGHESGGFFLTHFPASNL